MTQPYALLPAIALSALGLLWGCSSAESRSAVEPTAEVEVADLLPHYARLSSDFAQGGQPRGDEAFASLAKLGFRTVVSVDGAVPDVEAASAHGLRYVHVPIGYDGISVGAAQSLAAAATELDGPTYVHCHHGLHRGPAAAAIMRMAAEGLSREQALRDLTASGCSPKYEGLYRDVGAYLPPTPGEPSLIRAEDLPSAVRPSGLVGAMVHLSARVDYLESSRDVGWSVPPGAPDILPAHEAGMIENTLRDLVLREEAQGDDAAFLALLRDSHSAAVDLERALLDGGEVDAGYGRLRQSCKACHAQYRD